MTGIPWLFSLFVPFRPRFSVSSLVTITATWPYSFLLQLKQTWSYSQLFQIRIWRNPTAASRDFPQNCAGLYAAKLWDNLKILVVLPCLFILGWQKIARKKVVHAWLENIHTRLQWVVAISLRLYLRNSTYSFSPCTVFK